MDEPESEKREMKVIILDVSRATKYYDEKKFANHKDSPVEFPFPL